MAKRDGHRRSQLSKRAIDAAQPEKARYELWDEALPGFGLRVTPTGVKTFILRYRARGGGRRAPKRFVTIGRYGPLTPDQARNEARALLGSVARGKDPAQEARSEASKAANTFQATAERYLQREGKNLRTADWRKKVLARLVYPKLGSRPIGEIRRSEIVELLDKIEDANGAVMADRTLATIRRVMTWHASRSDDFRSPIVRGMTRTKAKEHARQRVLSDDELRVIWEATEENGPFGAMVQFILLTATRRNEAAKMSRGELSGRNWLIPGARNKSKADFLIPLSADAKALLDKLPRIGEGTATSPVFTTDGKRGLGGFSKFKTAFDKRVVTKLKERSPKASAPERWTLHDLRRTARTLMARAGVAPDHAERALGHVLPGIRGVYDVHEYYEEKRRAFESLAKELRHIVRGGKR
jgi:integrase